MSDVVCVICRKGLREGLSLQRINAKGVPGIWACRAHVSQTDAKRDPELEAIVDLLTGKGGRR
jgi:hypothetical protein